MTVKVASVLLDYASFYVAGSPDVDVPIEYGTLGVFGTRECLVITCLAWNEGETRITLGPFEELAPQPGSPEFDGVVETPGHRVLLSDASIDEILSMEVPDTRTRVRIWTNHPTEPDDVVIALG